MGVLICAVGIDPYNYEQKFSKDEKFKEIGPMARMWKTFLKEYSKFDSNMVKDWRDALDMLLVFVSNPSCYVIQHSVTPHFRLDCSLLLSPPSSLKAPKNSKSTFPRPVL